jgi:hypothetical protein
MNRGAVQGREIFPLNGALSALHMASALPFDDRIYVGRVKGSVLAALATSDRAGRFILRGITTDGGVKINGRAVEPDTMYRVVTTGFVYDGGEGGIGATDGVELEVYGSQGPREFLTAWLDRPHEGDITQIPVDPARRTRWSFNASLDLGFQLVDVDNPQVVGAMGGMPTGAYNNPQLSRTSAMTLRGDGRFAANANTNMPLVSSTARSFTRRSNASSPSISRHIELDCERSTREASRRREFNRENRSCAC